VGIYNGHFLKVNKSLCRILGYSDKELLTKTFQELTHPDDLETDLAYVHQVLAGEIDIYEMEKRYRHKQGGLVWAQLNVSLVRDSTGKPMFFIAQVQDISRRKNAETSLLESEACFEVLTSQLNDVFWISTADGAKVLDLNHSFEKVYGISENEFRLNPGLWLEMVHPDDQTVARASHDELLRTGHAQAEYRIVRPDGEVRFLRDRKALFYDQDYRPVRMGGIANDITEINNKEREKEKLRKQLIQAQKLEAVGKLAGGVAHDYNNMLSVIIGNTDLALGKVDPGSPLNEDLMEILSAAHRSADITRQLLAFARQQTVAPKVVDLNKAVKEILSMIRRLIGENIDLSWLPGEKLEKVKIDPTQIDQILANLCVNARDAIADVGKITIETKNTAFDEVYCSDHAEFIPGEYVCLTVSDDGCGMDKETLDQIFEPFFTTKTLGKGTGLGLATVYGIVRQNGGFITVYSEPGEGTSYHIYLPRYVGQAYTIQKKKKINYIYGKGETILVVEDEVSILKLTKKILEGLGYGVLTASTPGDAMRLADEHAGDIHLLLTDVVMPEMNGKDLAGQLQSLYPDIKCLFMSGYTANVIAHRGVLDENLHFIQKPVSRNELAAKIRSVLEMESEEMFQD